MSTHHHTHHPGNGSVCIITPDIVGPVKNGGIGTAYYHLALFLADNNYELTIVFAGRQPDNLEWMELYTKKNISFVFLPPPTLDLKDDQRSRSYAVFEFLKDSSYDIIHFPEWGGLAYYPLQGKKAGMMLQNTQVCVTIHSPSIWNALGNEGVNVAEDFLLRDFMERQSVAHADILVCPSNHLKQWVTQRGWQAAQQAKILQYIIGGQDRKVNDTNSPKPIGEIVFFGRLEPRKGISEFLCAIDLLNQDTEVNDISVTFLGRRTHLIDKLIDKHTAKWNFPTRLITDYSAIQAIDYLKQGERLAVMPSRIDNLPLTVFECLSHNIPFIASTRGGIPEQVHQQDHQKTLCDLQPDLLAMQLKRAVTSGQTPANFGVSQQQTRKECIEFHEKLVMRACETAPSPRNRHRPLVSVCITHFDRPQLLKQAVDSYLNQSYTPLEIIIVDDGSWEKQSHLYLDELTQIDTPELPVTVIKQKNRYPGAARNTAARVAKGDYLLFADDDNIATGDEVEHFVHAATHSNSDILLPIVTRFSGDHPPSSFDGISAWLPLGGSISPSFLANCFGDAHFFIQTEAYWKIGGFTEERIGFEDYEFHARASFKGLDFCVVPVPTFWYRETNTGVGKKRPKIANQLRVTRTYMRHLPPEIMPLLVHMSLHREEMRELGKQPVLYFLAHKLRYNYPKIYNFIRTVYLQARNVYHGNK